MQQVPARGKQDIKVTTSDPCQQPNMAEVERQPVSAGPHAHDLLTFGCIRTHNGTRPPRRLVPGNTAGGMRHGELDAAASRENRLARWATALP